jgi:GT2 family glycosyltransferase
MRNPLQRAARSAGACARRVARGAWHGAEAGACESILRSGLFEPGYYRLRQGAAIASGADALGHFLERGAARGLQPHPLFDPVFYRARAAAFSERARNPLLHYLRRGSRRGLRPNRFFDPSYYRAANPDVSLEGFEPLQHYASRGWREQRATSAEFDPLAYRQAHPGLPGWIDPLAHLLRRIEAGEDFDPEAFARAAPSCPAEPSAGEWARLPSPPPADSAVVDVVMPVYGGRAETLRAIHRVLSARNRCPFELVVVNDASPDPGITAALDALARRGLITLLVNERNCGFVVSSNRGMARHADRDVVLLNADTEVYGDWLDRLRATVHRAGNAGTATPWSNAATIMSYPITLRDNHVPLETDGAGIDALAAGLEGPAIDLPTGVGFCLYVRRACLEQVGPFREDRFGRGYGEENDFCLRAAARGWRHRAAIDVYVHHHAGRSFGAEKADRVRAAIAEVERLHPSYRRTVHEFIRRDPLAPHRRRLDEARVRAAAGASDRAVIRLVPDVGPRFGTLRIEVDTVPITPNLPPVDPAMPPCDFAAAIGLPPCTAGDVLRMARECARSRAPKSSLRRWL